MNKLIFLDFDGVLHPTHCVGESPFNRVDLLEEALSGSTPLIVISSSWRFTHSLDKIKKLLPNSIANLVIGTTGAPVIGKHARFQEILAFLNTYEQTNWRALDDSYWEFPSNCKELIRCNPNLGISPREILQLSTWLNSK